MALKKTLSNFSKQIRKILETIKGKIWQYTISHIEMEFIVLKALGFNYMCTQRQIMPEIG